MRPKMPGVWCQRRGAALIAAVYAGECALVWDIAGSVSADGLAAVIHECVCVLCPRRLSPAQHRSAAAASATASGGGSASGAHLRRRQSLGGATPAPAEKNLLRSALASAGAAALPRLVVTCSLPWNQRGDCAVRRSRLSNRLFRCRQRASGAARVCAAFLVLCLGLTRAPAFLRRLQRPPSGWVAESPPRPSAAGEASPPSTPPPPPPPPRSLRPLRSAQAPAEQAFPSACIELPRPRYQEQEQEGNDSSELSPRPPRRKHLRTFARKLARGACLRCLPALPASPAPHALRHDERARWQLAPQALNPLGSASVSAGSPVQCVRGGRPRLPRRQQAEGARKGAPQGLIALLADVVVSMFPDPSSTRLGCFCLSRAPRRVAPLLRRSFSPPPPRAWAVPASRLGGGSSLRL